MKKSLVFSVIFAACFVLAVSCGGNGDSNNNDNDNTPASDEEPATDEDGTEPASDEEPQETDGDTVPGEDDPCAAFTCPENATCTADGEECLIECNEGFHPNAGTCIPDTELTQIGEFTADFAGPINTAIALDGTMLPGEGDAVFTYFDDEFTYQSQQLPQEIVEALNIDLSFPTTVKDGFMEGMLSVIWVDQIDFNALLAGASLRFIAINIPATLAAGEEYDFVENEIFAFYGDLNIDMSSSKIGAKCVRAVSGVESTLTISEVTENSITISAHGDLIDPQYAVEELGVEIPEICAE
ncbi:hypothetical protein J5834_01330 [bacterium]|nr:hypothetical protein [bacterium]